LALTSTPVLVAKWILCAGLLYRKRESQSLPCPSETSKGVSRIVPFLKEGAGVVTTRGHVHWVVTEYGIVNLFGKSLKQRAKALIDIAHPDHRETLERAYFERFASMPSLR
jgi:acyl-CoA hydrolase